MCRPDDFPPYDGMPTKVWWTNPDDEPAYCGACGGTHTPTCDEVPLDLRVGIVYLDDARDDAGAPCPPDCTNVKPHDHDPDLVAQPSGMFRSLDATADRAFREWARANWQPGQYVNPVWHPVVRDECRVMTEERAR